MGKVYQGTLGLIGNTPLVELTHIEKKYGLEAKLLAKCIRWHALFLQGEEGTMYKKANMLSMVREEYVRLEMLLL